MKTICVAGSRTLGYETDPKTGIMVLKRYVTGESDIVRVLHNLFYEAVDFFDLDLTKEPVKIIHGACPTGVDKIADDFFRSEHPESQVLIEMFPADWKTYGKAAGPIRNQEMARLADALILVWDGKSPGSKNCRSEFTKLGKPVFEKIISEKDV